MPLPPAAPDRQPKHTRRVELQVYARPDGLWEIDARLTDTKTRDWQLASGLRPAGTPVHDMLLRLVVDTRFNVIEAGSRSDWMPYPGECNRYTDDAADVYGRLVGLNLMRGFGHAVKQRLGGVQGCTHLTELTRLLPTAMVQAFAGEAIDVQEGSTADTDQQPFQIDRCHALRSDRAVVLAHYPRWARPAAAHNAARAPQPATDAAPAIPPAVVHPLS